MLTKAAGVSSARAFQLEMGRGMEELGFGVLWPNEHAESFLKKAYDDVTVMEADFPEEYFPFSPLVYPPCEPGFGSGGR